MKPEDVKINHEDPLERAYEAAQWLCAWSRETSGRDMPVVAVPTCTEWFLEGKCIVVHESCQFLPGKRGLSVQDVDLGTILL